MIIRFSAKAGGGRVMWFCRDDLDDIILPRIGKVLPLVPTASVSIFVCKIRYMECIRRAPGL